MIKTGKKKLYSVDDLTKILPITPLTIRNYIKAGKIKGGYKIGKSWYVTKENLEAFLDGPGQEVKGITES
jgi:predicted site-specific integrase-resolvase